MNRLNYAQRSNFIAGSSEIFRYEFYIQDFNLPGLTVNTVESYSQGMKHLISGDSITHTELDITILIDEDFLVYQAIKKWLEDSVNQVTGSFADREFTFYCEVHNNKGNYLFTVMFYGCKILTLSDVQLSSTDDSFSNTVSVSIEYDWFEFKKEGLPDDWKKQFNIVEINENTEDEDDDEEETTDSDIIIKDDCDCLLDGDKLQVKECECSPCEKCCNGCECNCNKCECNCNCKDNKNCKCKKKGIK